MELVKNYPGIPPGRETFKVKELFKNYSTMDSGLKEAHREVTGHGPMCFKCNCEFKNGEKICLAVLEYEGARMLCPRCTDKVENTAKPS